MKPIEFYALIGTVYVAQSLSATTSLVMGMVFGVIAFIVYTPNK